MVNDVIFILSILLFLEGSRTRKLRKDVPESTEWRATKDGASTRAFLFKRFSSLIDVSLIYILKLPRLYELHTIALKNIDILVIYRGYMYIFLDKTTLNKTFFKKRKYM